MLIGSEPQNFLRRLDQVVQRRKQTVKKLYFRMFEMMTNFSKFTSKIRRCAKRYNDAPCIVWAAYIYKVSFRKVVELGLIYKFQLAEKRVYHPDPLQIVEVCEEQLSSEGHDEVFEFKKSLLQNGKHFYRGKWHFARDGVFLMDEDIPRKGTCDVKAVVPIHLIREFERLYFTQTTCSYENMLGGGYLYTNEYMNVYEWGRAHYGTDEVNIKIGTVEDYSINEHALILNFKFSIVFDQDYRGPSKVWLQRSSGGPTFESEYGPMHTKYSHRGTAYYKVVLGDQVRQHKFTFPVVGDRNGGDHSYVLSIRTQGRFRVYEAHHVMISNQCFAYEKYNISCSCNTIRQDYPVCQFRYTDRCVPYVTKCCSDCDVESKVKEVLLLGDRTKSDNPLLSLESMKKSYFRYPVEIVRKFLSSVADVYKLQLRLEEKYNAIVVPKNDGTLLFLSYNLFRLDEYDFLNFSMLYQQSIMPENIDFELSHLFVLKRVVKYPPSVPVLLTGWKIYESSVNLSDPIRDFYPDKGKWWD